MKMRRVNGGLFKSRGGSDEHDEIGNQRLAVSGLAEFWCAASYSDLLSIAIGVCYGCFYMFCRLEYHYLVSR